MDLDYSMQQTKSKIHKNEVQIQMCENLLTSAQMCWEECKTIKVSSGP